MTNGEWRSGLQFLLSCWISEFENRRIAGLPPAFAPLGFSYDAAGNLTNDLGQNFQYDVTGQQTSASYGGYSLSQAYDGDGLRVQKNDNASLRLRGPRVPSRNP